MKISDILLYHVHSHSSGESFTRYQTTFSG